MDTNFHEKTASFSVKQIQIFHENVVILRHYQLHLTLLTSMDFETLSNACENKDFLNMKKTTTNVRHETERIRVFDSVLNEYSKDCYM